jgi:hypothetical protein
MKGALLFSRPSGTQPLFSNLSPALKCWAIVNCPSGTESDFNFSNSL